MENHLTSSAHGISYRPFLFTVAWQMLSSIHAHSIVCNHGQCGEPPLACTCGDASAMTKSEGHSSYFYGLSAPSMFCPIHSLATAHGHQAKSLNMSWRGVYFVTSHPVCVWLPVQILLRRPGRIAIFTGRVRDVEWQDVPSGMAGFGVVFFYWQTPSESGPLNQMQA